MKSQALIRLHSLFAFIRVIAIAFCPHILPIAGLFCPCKLKPFNLLRRRAQQFVNPKFSICCKNDKNPLKHHNSSR
jgi:hypothetical protein